MCDRPAQQKSALNYPRDYYPSRTFRAVFERALQLVSALLPSNPSLVPSVCISSSLNANGLTSASYFIFSREWLTNLWQIRRPVRSHQTRDASNPLQSQGQGTGRPFWETVFFDVLDSRCQIVMIKGGNASHTNRVRGRRSLLEVSDELSDLRRVWE